MSLPGRIRIGISNVVIPGNKQSFPVEYQQTSRLHYYASIFDTVEINKCFYKTPLVSTYEKWARDVPEDFQFSLKVSKEVSHSKELKSDPACLHSFVQAARGTGQKKGCLLLQFPGKITLDHFNEVEVILREMNQQDPGNEWRKAVEFRNESWYIRETTELLDQYGAATVLHDFAKGKHWSTDGKSDFVYVRFHGPQGNYRDSYSDQFLHDKAKEFKLWLSSGKDVYVYFNNTIGNAFENALQVRRFIQLE